VANGYYFVFDRRAHAIYMVDPERANARKVVDIGQEEGRIIQPGGFDSAAKDRSWLRMCRAARSGFRFLVLRCCARAASSSPAGQCRR